RVRTRVLGSDVASEAHRPVASCDSPPDPAGTVSSRYLLAITKSPRFSSHTCNWISLFATAWTVHATPPPPYGLFGAGAVRVNTCWSVRSQVLSRGVSL